MFWMMLMTVYLVYFFFFQAEDGIRDKLVTGVQTCALPISCGGRREDRSSACAAARAGDPLVNLPARGRAAGKVILLGEHAVVYRRPALVAGLSLGLEVEVTASDGALR